MCVAVDAVEERSEGERPRGGGAGGQSRMVRRASPEGAGGAGGEGAALSDWSTSSMASSLSVCSAPQIICSSRVTCNVGRICKFS